jgi:hypothetical protein
LANIGKATVAATADATSSDVLMEFSHFEL